MSTYVRIKKENGYVSINEKPCEQRMREARNAAKKQSGEGNRENFIVVIEGSGIFLISFNGMPLVKQFSPKPQQCYYIEETLPWKIGKLCSPGQLA